MTDTDRTHARGYDSFYEKFDSPLMRRLRQEAYGQDIGQHSWTTAGELAQDIPRLQLTRAGRLLDLGCGPGGPLTFVVSQVGCRAVGVDLSPPAIDSARLRAVGFGIAPLIEFQVADLNEPLPFEAGCFDSVLSVDVVLHLRDRTEAFLEVARILAHKGRFLFTDAGVITGPLSSDEFQRRAAHGFTQLAPAGFNEQALKETGFRLLESADRTPGLLACATGRLASRTTHRAELEPVEGTEVFETQLRYLQTVVALAGRGAVSRVMYLAGHDAIPDRRS